MRNSDATNQPSYDIIATTDLLRMVIITLDEHQEVPWHWHKECPDTFFGMEGQVKIETVEEGESDVVSNVLLPGQMMKVEARVRHRVSGVDGMYCRVAVLQGVGRYDLQIG